MKRTIILAVMSQKGGTGKTNISTNLATAAELNGLSTLLLDLDPQTSSCTWGDVRESPVPAIMDTPATRLQQRLENASAHGADLVILDTPPNADGTIMEVARASDLILVPCKPSRADLKAVKATLDIAETAKTPAHFVLSMVDPRTNLGQQAREAMKGYKNPCAPCQISERVAFIKAYNHGLGVMEYAPGSKASKEIQELYTYVTTEMRMRV